MSGAVLCIGGLDPSGRAGLLADARAVEGVGGRALCVATALTFQSSTHARGFVAVEPDVLRRQLDVLLEDEPINAIKLGQLASLENARVLAERLPPCPLVVDTPLVTSSGVLLLPQSDVFEAYEPLFRRATLVTPNAVEALALSRNLSDPIEAVRSIPTTAVLLKGGHLGGEKVVDRLFVERTEVASWESERLPGRYRGTGCRLASAIAAELGKGEGLRTAISSARTWLVERLEEES